MLMPRICIVPKVKTGGMASFRLKFEDGLRSRGIEVTYNLNHKSDAILVIGGTRHLIPLLRARVRGTRIVQRLDGINWVQRVRWSGLGYTLRAEYGNALLAFIRNYIAHQVIYQSEFIRSWWEAWYGMARASGTAILNGVNLEHFNPNVIKTSQQSVPIPKFPPFRLLVVEGSLAGGLDTGLNIAVRLAELLSKQFPIILNIAGKVDSRAEARMKKDRDHINFLGLVPREQIPELMRSSHLLFSAEINPPCPNSVIEAMASGLPVVGFDTGSLYELLGDDAGRCVPYGTDPWKLEAPDIPLLAKAATEILKDQGRFRLSARTRAEALFNVDDMINAYLEILLED